MAAGAIIDLSKIYSKIMKQTSSTTRGRKKAAGASASRGGSASQHRTGGRNASSGSRTNGTSNRTGNAAGSGSRRGGEADSRSNSGRISDADIRNSSRGGESRNRNAPNERTALRGNSAGVSAGSRSRPESGSAQHGFTGESHLEKFFLNQLQDIYYAENKITQSLPKMAEAATTGELRDAFEDHLHQTQRHIKRLEKAFESLGKKAEAKKCEAIEGIAREVDNIIEETEEGTLTRDAALIIAAQKVEHYEIATYGGLVQLAITMNLHDAADLLDKTLVEEEDTDARLTEIAENEINLRAEHEDTQSSWNAGEEEEQGEGEENENEEDEHPSM